MVNFNEWLSKHGLSLVRHMFEGRGDPYQWVYKDTLRTAIVIQDNEPNKVLWSPLLHSIQDCDVVAVLPVGEMDNDKTYRHLDEILNYELNPKVTPLSTVNCVPLKNRS